METQMGLAMFLMVMIWGGVKAQDCTNVIISMSPCLNYIQGNSNSPSSGCCTQLASVVRSQPQCLCQVLSGGGSSLGININQTQALELPKACNVQTPPVSQCKAGGSPADSPAGTPGTSGSVPSGIHGYLRHPLITVRLMQPPPRWQLRYCSSFCSFHPMLSEYIPFRVLCSSVPVRGRN